MTKEELDELEEFTKMGGNDYLEHVMDGNIVLRLINEIRRLQDGK